MFPTVQWTLSASFKMSALPFPQFLHPNPEAVFFGSEPWLWQGMVTTAREFLGSAREVNCFLAQLLGHLLWCCLWTDTFQATARRKKYTRSNWLPIKSLVVVSPEMRGGGGLS